MLLGKYAAYIACTTLVVLPATMLVYFVVVPAGEIPSSFVLLLGDLGVLALGLAAYGALFALIGAVFRRPLISGLVFAFGWEQAALLVPGYLRQFTLAYYVQALVPHTMPSTGVMSFLQGAFSDTPSPVVSALCLLVAAGAALSLAVRVVERREYVLEQ